MVRLPKIIVFLVFLSGFFVFSACGVVEVGVEPTKIVPSTSATEPQFGASSNSAPITLAPVTTATPTESETAPLEAQNTPNASHSPLWVAYRDPRYDYGLALPCYWNIYPTDKNYDGSPSIRSYDEAFFFAHATKGQWNDGVWPAGAVKFDTFVSQGIDPTLSLEEAVQQALNANDFGTIQSMQAVTVGSNSAMQVSLEDPGDANLPDSFYMFRISPDRLLYFSVMPRHALETPDVQNILSSLAFTPQDEITIPVAPPSGPVEGREIYFDEQAGYCFSYPSEASVDSNLPSQPTFLGKAASLKLERPLYDVAMAIDVQKVGEGISLDELVSRFLEQFSNPGSATITDYVPKISGEPAKVVENVPGRDGGRDLFALHEGKLYHLYVRPSSIEFTQANADLDYLFLVVTSSMTFIP